MKRAILPQPFPMTDIRAENATTKTFILDGSLTADPGQFVMAWLPGLEDKPFSLLNADPISLTIAAVGPFSRAVHQLGIGDLLWVRGPLGHGFRLPQDAGHLLLVGGGYGVAPMLFLTRLALAQGHQVSMVIGARSKDSLLLTNAFRELGVSLWLTTEDASAGIHGRVTDAVPRILHESPIRPTSVYACGSTPMLEAVAAQCRRHGLPVQLAWEAHMRCGIGLCGSCEVGDGWLTCLDGPVFGFDPAAGSRREG